MSHNMDEGVGKSLVPELVGFINCPMESVCDLLAYETLSDARNLSRMKAARAITCQGNASPRSYRMTHLKLCSPKRPEMRVRPP